MLDIKEFFTIPHKIWLVFGFIFGLTIIILLPPLQNPDEPNHFIRAYQVSRGEVISYKDPNITTPSHPSLGGSDSIAKGEITGGYIPSSVVDMKIRWLFNVTFNGQNKISFKDIKSEFSTPLNNHVTEFDYFQNTALYSPIPYLPSAIAIFVGKKINMAPVTLMYMARIATFLVSYILIFFALKKMPFLKFALLLVCFLPITIAQLASNSADSLTISLSLLFISLILNYRFELAGTLEKKQIITIFTLSALIVLCKQAYFPLLLLVLILPKNKFLNKSNYWITTLGSMGFSVLVYGIWSYLIKDIFVAPRFDVLVDPGLQIKYILNNPLSFLNAFIRGYVLGNDYYIKQLVGVLGWNDAPVSWFLVVVSYVVIILVSIKDNVASIKIPKQIKYFLALLVAAGVSFISLLIYLGFNKVGETEGIAGLQGRYFIPLIPLVLVTLYANPQSKEIKKNNLALISLLYILLSIFLTVLAVLNRYYLSDYLI